LAICSIHLLQVSWKHFAPRGHYHLPRFFYYITFLVVGFWLKFSTETKGVCYYSPFIEKETFFRTFVDDDKK
jgi:hypothetical protein